MRVPQWYTLATNAAARAIYEALHPTRTDNGFPEGAEAWEHLETSAKEPYIDAGDAAADAYRRSSLVSSRLAVESFRRGSADA